MKSIREYMTLLNEGQLNELADAPYAISREDKTTGSVWYRFETDKKLKYLINFALLYSYDNRHEYYLDFALNSDMDDGSANPYGITSTGDAFRVFASIKSALVDFLNGKHPTKIEFDSSQPSRTKLYKKMMAYLKSNVSEYDFIVDEKYDFKCYFYIVKKNIIVKELFDREVKLQKLPTQGRKATYRFHKNDESYLISIGPFDKDTIEMIFTPRQHNDITEEYRQKLVQEGLVDLVFYAENAETGVFSKNNSGQEFFTFTCVVQALSDYLQSHPTSCFSFCGERTEPSRIKLYDKMAEFFAKRFGYNLRIHLFGRKKIYVLQKWAVEE